MKTLARLLLVLTVGLAGVSTVAAAGMIDLTPNLTATTTVEGATRAALTFDLNEVSGMDVAGAWLEMDLSGVSAESRSEFALYTASDNWSSAGDVANLVLAEEPDAIWDIEILDYQRSGGFVRFDVTDLVRAWISGSTANHGLVIVTSDMSAQGLGGQISGAVLRVHE